MTTQHDTPRKRSLCDERPDKPGMYLALFHGRDDRREQMEPHRLSAVCPQCPDESLQNACAIYSKHGFGFTA